MLNRTVIVTFILTCHLFQCVYAEGLLKDQFIQLFGQGCSQEFKQLSPEARNRIVTMFGNDYINQYCSCVSGALQETLDTKVIAYEDQAELASMVQAAGSKCATTFFIKSFPSLCETWFLPVFGQHLARKKFDELCQCMYKPIKTLQPNRLAMVTQDTILDYKYFSEHKQYPKKFREHSMLQEWQVCLDEPIKIFKKEHKKSQ